VRHFTRAEGVELSPEFPDFLYAELKKELQKSKVFQEIASEDEVVDAADAERSLSVEGILLEYKKGSPVKEIIIGYGAGLRSLRAHITVRRRSNHESLVDQELKVRASSRLNDKALAQFLAHKIAGAIKHELGH
jgi:hypothetical protein